MKRTGNDAFLFSGSRTLRIFRLREPNRGRETLTLHVVKRGPIAGSPSRDERLNGLLHSAETGPPEALRFESLFRTFGD